LAAAVNALLDDTATYGVSLLSARKVLELHFKGLDMNYRAAKRMLNSIGFAKTAKKALVQLNDVCDQLTGEMP
jgi:hypothetical protein